MVCDTYIMYIITSKSLKYKEGFLKQDPGYRFTKICRRTNS